MSGSATGGPEGVNAQGQASTSYDDGRSSQISGAGHWSQDAGPSGNLDASRAQSVTFADSDTSWQRREQATTASASYGSSGWLTEVARSSGQTSHYKGHEVSTSARSAVNATQDGVGMSHQSGRSVSDDGVRNDSQRDSSVGWSWEHGLNLGYGTSSTVSDGADFSMSNSAGVTYDRGVAQGTLADSSHAVDADGRVLDNSNNYMAGWDVLSGFFGALSQSSSIVDGEDRQQRESSLAYSAEQGLSAHWASSSRQTDDDGVVSSEERGAQASWTPDVQSVGLSRTTSRDDDGIVRSTDTRGGVNYTDAAGVSAQASTSRVLSDGDDFRLERSADMALSSQGGHGSYTSASHVVDASGAVHDARQSGGAGWNSQGFFTDYSQARSVMDGQDRSSRESTIGYRDGALNVGSAFHSQLLTDDGTLQTADTSYGGMLGPSGARVSARHATESSIDGITGTQSTEGEIGRDADGNMSLRLGAHRGIADGEEYYDRSGVTLQSSGGEHRAQYTSSVRSTDVDGVVQDQDRTMGGGFGNGRAAVSASQTNRTLDDGISTSRTNAANASIGPNGQVSVEGTHRQSLSLGGDESHRELGARVSSDGVGLSSQSGETWTDIDGVGNSQSRSTGATFDGERATLNQSLSSSTKQADGTSQTNSGSASISTDGQLTGQMSNTQTNADGSVRQAVSASGSADLFGDSQSLTGRASLTRGKQTYSLGGGIQVEVNAPVQRGDEWVVTYRQGVQLNAGGSASGGGGVDAGGSPRGGVSGGLTADSQITSSGVRTFASEAEATAFYERPSAASMTGPSTNIDDVLALRTGDSTSSLMSGSVGGQGSASWGAYLTLSAGVQAGQSTGMTVERGSGQTVTVSVEDASTLEGTAGLATLGVGMSGGRNTSDSQTHVWSFDLSTPSGREAYTAYVGEGRTPVATDGVVLQSETTEVSEQTSQAINVPGGNLEMTAGTTSSVTDLHGGGKIERDSGYRGFLGSVPLLNWSASERHSMDFMEINDERRVMAARSTVNNSDAGDAYSGLARAAGILGESNLVQGESSGAFTYDTTFPEESMDRFIASVEGREYNPHSGVMVQRHGVEMQNRIREASGDSDAQRRILAEFLKDSGERGVRQIRDTIGGAQGYLHLEGSETFIGLQGHRELQAEIDRALGGLSNPAGATAAYGELNLLNARLERMRGDATNQSKYIDVPPSIRNEEVQRIRGLQTRVEEGVAQASVSLMDQPGNDVFVDPNSVQTETGRLGDVFDTARQAESDMDTAERRADGERSLHEEWKMRPARTVLGQAGLFGGARAGAGSEYQAYVQIDELVANANQYRGGGYSLKGEALGLGRLGEAAERAITFWSAAGRQFAMANDTFDSVYNRYRAIESRHPDKPHLWRRGR